MRIIIQIYTNTSFIPIYWSPHTLLDSFKGHSFCPTQLKRKLYWKTGSNYHSTGHFLSFIEIFTMYMGFLGPWRDVSMASFWLWLSVYGLGTAKTRVVQLHYTCYIILNTRSNANTWKLHTGQPTEIGKLQIILMC